jgi:hypothetical protein
MTVHREKRINNDLWLIEPDSVANKKDNIKIRQIQAMGQAPVPRYAHAACFFQKRYMAVYGGRNDYLMSEASKFMLNDLHLYDISKF